MSRPHEFVGLQLGVVLLPEKDNPVIRKRIEELGRMNDRYNALRNAGDKPGLLRLAGEYECHKPPMLAMAATIRREAAEL